MNEKFRYEIPRNVKAGGLFLKLNLKGWIIFMSVSSLFITVIVWGFEMSLIRTVIGLLGIACTYYSLEIDENTGESNISGLAALLDKTTAKGKLTPKWGGNDYEETKKPVHINIKARK